MMQCSSLACECPSAPDGRRVQAPDSDSFSSADVGDVRLNIRGQIWQVWLTAGLAGCVVYVLLPTGSLAASVCYLVVGLLSVCMGLMGISRHRPLHRWAWLLFISGQCMFMAGDVVRQVDEYFGGIGFPSPSDALYLLAYPIYFVALSTLGWADQSKRTSAAMLDSAILTVSFGLLYWVFVIDPIAAGDALSPLARTVALAYPICDVLFLAAVARTVTQAGKRTPSMNLLMAGTAATLLADIGFSTTTTQIMPAGLVLNVGWLLSYVVWGAAAQHPSMRAVHRSVQRHTCDQTSRPRTILLTCCILQVPAVLFLQGFDDPTAVSWLAIGVGAVVVFLLIMIRLSGFVDQVQAQSDQLHVIASRDDLTGLANRRELNQWLIEAVRTPSTHVLMLDLNGFKKVNDRHGHGVGDRLLVEVSNRLVQRLRLGDRAGRMGGDEFAVLVFDCTAVEADTVARRIAEALFAPIDIDGTLLRVGASIGTADCSGDNPTEILRRADVAMYAAKTAGDACRRYCPDLDRIENSDDEPVVTQAQHEGSSTALLR